MESSRGRACSLFDCHGNNSRPNPNFPRVPGFFDNFSPGEFISEFSIVERKIRGGRLGKEERVIEKE